MRTEEITLEKALSKSYWQQEEYQYVWIQAYSRVLLLPVEESEDLKAEDLLEARIFSEKQEIHIFPSEFGMKAIVTIGEPGDDYIEEQQILRERFGKTMTLKNYVDYDSDGQAYIIRTVAMKCH